MKELRISIRIFAWWVTLTVLNIFPMYLESLPGLSGDKLRFSPWICSFPANHKTGLRIWLPDWLANYKFMEKKIKLIWHVTWILVIDIWISKHKYPTVFVLLIPGFNVIKVRWSQNCLTWKENNKMLKSWDTLISTLKNASQLVALVNLV